LVRDVDVFLFDEPLSNLDAKLRGELRVEIKRLHHELKNTMIYVTHDQIEAMTLADRIAIMKGGVIQQLGTPAEIYHRPVNRFVASFIGSPTMNFVEGEVRPRAGGFRFVAPGMDLDLAAYLPRTVLASSAAGLGFRPEHLTICDAGDPQSLAGQVSVVEPMGAETIVWFTHAGGTASVRVMEELHFEIGAPIHVRIDAARTSLFAANNERI
jgi:multiple sugar transport system ATP-binding protein